MRASIRKIVMAALAVATVAGATVAATGSAEAHWRRGGWGWGGPALVGGLALGAFAASRPYYGPAYGYGYYDDGCLRRRVVGYTPYGRPIVRAVNVCY